LFSAIERALDVGMRLTEERDLIDSSSPLTVVNSCDGPLLGSLTPPHFLQGLHVQHFAPYYNRLKSRGFHVCASFDQPCPQVLIVGDRVRDVNRLYFALARNLVASGGLVVVSIANEFGSKSARKDFSELFEDVVGDSKGHCRVFWSRAPGAESSTLSEWLSLGELQAVQGTELCSHVGNFSYRRPDKASELLASCFSDLNGRGADLGAGYGLLGQSLLQISSVKKIYAIEADWRAVSAGKSNLKDERVVWVWGDVMDHSLLSTACDVNKHGLLDWVVMNPPFHAESSESLELGLSFFRAALSVLRPGGKLLWVANAHLPYPKLLGWGELSFRKLVWDREFVVGCFVK
jgi:16S rRNA (guanine1207-N2)-methyltransferase